MNPLVSLAKEVIETYITQGKIIFPPQDLPKEFLERKAGTFVSIFKIHESTRIRTRIDTNKKELRGCIGTYLPLYQNIAEEVIYNAIAAAAEDYRFGPIQIEELPYLSYTVYILNEPELVKDLKELDPKKYGIIIKIAPITPSGNVVFNGHLVAKTGLLLPDLEEVDTIEQQLSIVCHKAGINPVEEKILIYKFTVEKYQ